MFYHLRHSFKQAIGLENPPQEDYQGSAPPPGLSGEIMTFAPDEYCLPKIEVRNDPHHPIWSKF